MIPVRLTYGEVLLAWYVAAQRATNALKKARDKGLTGKHGAEPYSWALDVKGALGELAASKALNLSWCNHTAIGRIDVGELVEVRAVQEPHHKMIMHDEDKDDVPYALVDLSNLPDAVLVGWLRGKDGKSKDWWGDEANNGRLAYWVPRDALNDAEELRAWCHRKLAGV